MAGGERRSQLTRASWATALILLAALLSGCAQLGLGGGLTVSAFPDRYVLELSPDQTVALLRRCGFTDRQILRTGLDVRNALAISGGARICRNGRASTVLVAHRGLVHAACWQRGSFIYDASSGEFR